ncbi:uncharacterized protein LOC144799382 [Lissotriton helveticus]
MLAGTGSGSKKGRVSFPPGTAAPAPVSPAGLSVEAVGLLRQLCVGQAALLNAFQVHDKKFAQVVAFMEGIHSDIGGLHRTVQSLFSIVTAAIQLSQAQNPAPVPSATTLPVATSDESDHTPEPSDSKYAISSAQQQHSKQPSAQTPSPKQITVTQERKGKNPSGDTQAHQAMKQASGSHASQSAPSEDTPIPKPAPKDKQTVAVPAVKLVPAKSLQKQPSKADSSTTSTPIHTPVNPGQEGNVGGLPGRQRMEKGKARPSVPPDPAYPHREGHHLHRMHLWWRVCLLCPPHFLLLPRQFLAIKSPRSGEAALHIYPHTLSHGSMSPPPRATMPCGPSSPPAHIITDASTSAGPLF